MAIVYVFSMTDPNNVGLFPPSVTISSWFQQLEEYIMEHSDTNDLSSLVLGNNGNLGVFFFKDETDFSSFLSAYTCTDASLIADINAWKLAHGITYEHKTYNLDDAYTSIPGIF